MKELSIHIDVKDNAITVTGEGLHFLGNRMISKIERALNKAARMSRGEAVRKTRKEEAEEDVEVETKEPVSDNARRLLDILKTKTDEVN